VTDKPIPSFEELSAQLGPRLAAYLARISGSEADADDLLQETLMRIARALPEFEGRSSPKNWAYRIATNVAIDFLRKADRGQVVEFGESEERSEVDDEDRLILEQMNDCVRGVIDGLPPDHRAALILFNLEGRSVAETAQILDISVAAAKVRLHRARARLKEALSRQCTFYASDEGNLRCDRKGPGDSGGS
jgi:RNA polymerase sigma-70 factor (ECF subfamily)